MLLLFMEEQQAYWVLSVICEEFFAESYTLDMGKIVILSRIACCPSR